MFKIRIVKEKIITYEQALKFPKGTVFKIHSNIEYGFGNYAAVYLDTRDNLFVGQLYIHKEYNYYKVRRFTSIIPEHFTLSTENLEGLRDCSHVINL